jgi:L-cysteine:1D-myo-inositol 2-amino-2-deoxy-alpha-D-glucopyranoside ligase
MSFDVQGGGSDLAFPHHEMCAAQARAATGREPFARHFVHAGMVGYEGHKMSKSRGNLVFVSVLRRSGVSPAVIRLALLAHHYRSDWEWADADLRDAQARADRWTAALALPAAPPAEPVLAALRACLADDLDAPGALAAVDAWAAAALAQPATGIEVSEAPAELREAIDALLGVELRA